MAARSFVSKRRPAAAATAALRALARPSIVRPGRALVVAPPCAPFVLEVADMYLFDFVNAECVRGVWERDGVVYIQLCRRVTRQCYDRWLAVDGRSHVIMHIESRRGAAVWEEVYDEAARARVPGPADLAVAPLARARCRAVARSARAKLAL